MSKHCSGEYTKSREVPQHTFSLSQEKKDEFENIKKEYLILFENAKNSIISKEEHDEMKRIERILFGVPDTFENFRYLKISKKQLGIREEIFSLALTELKEWGICDSQDETMYQNNPSQIAEAVHQQLLKKFSAEKLAQ